MTEEEWWHGSKRMPTMKWLHRRGTARQFYLVGCAVVRGTWDQLPDQPYRNLIRLVEQYVDGRLSQEELSRAHRAAEAAAFEEYLALQNQGLSARRLRRRTAPLFASVHASDPAGSWEGALSAMAAVDGVQGRAVAWARQRAILHDVFGNPFEVPCAVDPCWLAWHDATVPRLAQSIYEERAFDRLPILADALEEAGCDQAALLDHCRQVAEHVRGCWVVDTLLGKMGRRPSPAKPVLFKAHPAREKAPSRRRERPSGPVILPMVRPT
jgi:hypothetical protein